MYLKNPKNERLRYSLLPRSNRQQGFVLILVLVLLSVLTLIGMSSMTSSSMELRATANAQQHQIAFNAVQAILEFSISKPTTNLINYQPDEAEKLIIQNIPAYTVASASSLTGTVEHTGCSVGVGSSLGLGKGFSYNFFNITGTGFNETTAGTKGSASSTQTQGVRFPAASC